MKKHLQIKLPKLHDSQQCIAQHPARFKVIASGRRFGKTELGKRLLIERTIYKRSAVGWWIAPTYGMAAQVWRELLITLSPLATGTSAANRRIDLPNGGCIAVRSGHNPDLLRGAGLDFVVLDEAAYLPPSLWPEVVRPMLLDRQGSAVFLSTPYGHNHFWNLYRLGLDPAEPEWASFRYTSYDNAKIPSAEIDVLRRTTPDIVFRAEYLAEFIEDMGAVFRSLDAAAVAPLDARPDPGRRVVIGVDWGRDVDFTACAVLDADRMCLLALDRFNGLSWAAARQRVAALSRRWYAAAVWAESNAIGQPNIEALQADGIPIHAFTTTARSKQPLIDALAVAIENGDIALLPDPVLLDELRAYRMQPLPGGGYRYSAPPGAHDDTVIALALAWHAARQGRFSLDFA